MISIFLHKNEQLLLIFFRAKPQNFKSLSVPRMDQKKVFDLSVFSSSYHCYLLQDFVISSSKNKDRRNKYDIRIINLISSL